MMQFDVTTRQNNHSFKLRYTFELAMTEHETLSICFASCKMYPDICQVKMSSGVSWLLTTSVLSSHALVRVLRLQHHYIFRWRFSPADGGAWVNLRINSVRLPLVTGHFDFLENLRQNCGQSIQCNARWGKSICSQLHWNQHHQSIHLCPSLDCDYQGEVDYSN